METALHYINFSNAGGTERIASTLEETARIADESGMSDFTVMDHWFQMETLASATDPMLEGYTTLGFLAGCTSRIRLSTMVTGVTYRHPGLLAKIVTTLDVLSGGRAGLGIGGAWYEREHLGLGVEFPSDGERLARLEEAIRICLQMWSDDDGPFHGRFYELAETICRPRPVSDPRPRLLVGGGGERVTLRIVAQYADACNLFPSTLEELTRKLEILDRHCAAVGRDPGEIERTVMTAVDQAGDLDEFLRTAEAWSGLGVTKVFLMPLAEPVPYATWLAEQVVPRLAAI